MGHVFQANDGGTCWDDISGDLIDAPANSVAIVASHLFVADDVGVFAAGLSGAHGSESASGCRTQSPWI